MDQDGSGLWVQRTIQESWFEVKTQRKLGTCFANHLGLKIIDRIVLGNRINEIKFKNGLDLLDRMKMRLIHSKTSNNIIGFLHKVES